MQATSTARRTPPAPAALNCVDVVPCIRGENSSVRGPATPVLCDTRNPHGDQPRLLLVHGSVVNADLTWSAQKPLAERFEIVAPNRRGFPPGPDVEHVDFEDEAVWLEQFLEPGNAPRRALVRRCVLALSGGSPARAAPVAHGDRAAGVRGRARHSRGGRVHGADRGALDERPTRSGASSCAASSPSSAPPSRPATSRPSSSRERGR